MLGRAPTPWKKARSGIRPPAQLRSGKHLQWIRTQRCVVFTGLCEGPVQAAHVRVGTDAGLSAKPSDNWTIPLCHRHHQMQHSIGERSFSTMFELELKRLALNYAKRSPCQRIKERVAGR